MMENVTFLRLMQQMGEELYREMPWREDTRPYYVLVSEIMLQQTQVDRVIPKFRDFIDQFPDEHSLAGAPLADVLRAWQGLGYNRRAKFLHDSAKQIVALGSFPVSVDSMTQLAGVGQNTAGAIMAYAYNYPSIFVETNVRAVYIHHFFDQQQLVSDREIIHKLSVTAPWQNNFDMKPRKFYWALMDYGHYLKKQGVGPSRSSQYKKQAPLHGSVREVRGQIITALTKADSRRIDLEDYWGADHRFPAALDGLIRDGLVQETNGHLHLTK